MTRIIAGQARGRRLAVPPGAGTRPTGDRAREGLFSALEAEFGGQSGRPGLAGITVLDLFAGSGALGLEALSRGAARATFVERDEGALRALRANADALGADAEIVRRDAVAFLANAAG
ncbi:MAG: RsmD family RNA methyltransferase, partial [Catenulispora sp.]